MSEGGTSWKTVARLGVLIGFALSLTFASLALVNSLRSGIAYEWTRALPLLAILSTPALLATIGLRRPPALLAAGVVSLPLAFISLAGLTLPLLIPAGFYVIAYRRAPLLRPRVPTPVIVVAVVALSASAFSVLVVHPDPRCVETVRRRDGTTYDRPASEADRSSRRLDENVIKSSCTSDVTTPLEAAASAGLAVLALAAGGWMAKPRPDAS